LHKYINNRKGSKFSEWGRGENLKTRERRRVQNGWIHVVRIQAMMVSAGNIRKVSFYTKGTGLQESHTRNDNSQTFSSPWPNLLLKTQI
jgi:hypothetical protein